MKYQYPKPKGTIENPVLGDVRSGEELEYISGNNRWIKPS